MKRISRIKKNNKLLLQIIFIVILFTLSFTLFSCEKKPESSETETPFIPVPANQFAVDKETEVETVEETKAHHIYPEDFVLKNDSTIVIGEKDYLTKINYIKNHVDDFKNSTIIVEGMYGLYSSWDKTFNFPMVYRNGPGCCGDDQYGGFYLVNIDQTQFQVDDWIEVEGTPFMYEHTDSENEVQHYLFLLVTKITKKTVKERKAEMVNS